MERSFPASITKVIFSTFVGFVLLITFISSYLELSAATPVQGLASPVVVSQSTTPPTAKPAANVCTGNKLENEVVVSISKRELWACQQSRVVYSSLVVTGYSKLASDVTPVGTYHIFTKMTNRVLVGSDALGSWHDNVSYWMPFLTNKYGTYGLHDATWRPASQFGKVDQSSPDASKGCVELPLNTAKWIYDWAPVGTTVRIVT